MISPVVAGNQSLSNTMHALATADESVTSHPSGARSSQTSSNFLKPGMLLAAIVLTGPAATRFDRIPRPPNATARYLLMLSSADFETPIQLYAGQATLLSKSRPTKEPPLVISGANASASALNEYALMCSAMETSPHAGAMKSSPRHASGANPIECSTPSTRPHLVSSAARTFSRCSGTVTSSSKTSTGSG